MCTHGFSAIAFFALFDDLVLVQDNLVNVLGIAWPNPICHHIVIHQIIHKEQPNNQVDQLGVQGNQALSWIVGVRPFGSDFMYKAVVSIGGEQIFEVGEGKDSKQPQNDDNQHFLATPAHDAAHVLGHADECEKSSLPLHYCLNSSIITQLYN